MLHNFRFRNRLCQKPSLAALPPAALGDPLLPLLRSLRGRQVALLVRGRELAGKLVTAEPLVLVGADGVATLVDPARIDSVAF